MEFDLRFFLLIVGAFFILAVFIDALWHKKKKNYPVAPKMKDDFPEKSEVFQIKHPSENFPEIPITEESIISVTILPKNQKCFSGQVLNKALKTSNFYFGKYNIFHKHFQDDPKKNIVYSVASLVEPGSFDIKTYCHHTYPGICLFMQIPILMDPISCLNDMLIVGRRLAICLQGKLCGGTRENLTIQIIENYREKIRQLAYKRIAKQIHI